MSVNLFMSKLLFYLLSLARSICNRRGVWLVFIINLPFRNFCILCKKCSLIRRGVLRSSMSSWLIVIILSSHRRIEAWRFSCHFQKGENFCDFCLLVCPTIYFEKESTLKRNNLLPVGANSFLIE